MNIRYDRVIAWIALAVLAVVLVFALATYCNTSEETASTPIEESNISISEEISIVSQEEEISEQEESAFVEEPVEEILPEEVLRPVAENYTRKEVTKYSECQQEILYLEQLVRDTQTAIDLVLELGYPEESEFIQLAYKDLEIYQQYIDYYELKAGQFELIRNTNSVGDDANARYIWSYLKACGYNDYVCAGIMGNLMAEVGGQSLYIQYWMYDNSYEYYGMCQWSLKYCPEVEGMTLDQQLKYLVYGTNNIKYNFTHFGKNYKNFSYEDFINLQDEKEAALAFAKVYERCASRSYSKRQENATKAYNYFVG